MKANGDPGRTKGRLCAGAGLLAAVLLGVLAAAAHRANTGAPAPGRAVFVQARQGEFVHVVRATGSLRAGELTGVTCPLDELVVTWRAPEGAAVKEGEVIFRLDRSGLEEQALQTTSDLGPAEAGLAAAQAEVERAKLAVEQNVRLAQARLHVAEARLALEEQRPLPADKATAEADLAEQTAALRFADFWLAAVTGLFEEGVASQRELDSAELEQHTAAGRRRRAEAALAETLKGADAADLEEARAALAEARMAVQVGQDAGDKRLQQAEARALAEQRKVEQLQKKLAELQADAEKTDIRAEHDGTLFAHAGERVNVGDGTRRGRVLADLARPSSLVMHVRVRECDSRLVAEGQSATVRLMATHGRPLDGTVTKVGKVLGETEQAPGLPCLDVEIALNGETPGVRPGMGGHAEIAVARIDKAVVVPHCTLSDGAVRVFKDGVSSERSVKVVASDGTYAAVGSGLQAGEWVAIPGGE